MPIRNVRVTAPASRPAILSFAAAVFSALFLSTTSYAVVLDPTDLFMSAYHIPVEGGVATADTRANAFQVLTNGVVDQTTTADKVDTWNGDATGVVNDFVGLMYGEPSRFDSVTVELGAQFGDGGDWEALPTVYVLKNPRMVGGTVEPNLSPAWVPLAGAVETTGHVFDPIVVPGPGGTITFDLTSIPALDRTGWGWAVGGVDGNHRASDGRWNFINVTEVFADGEIASPPPTLKSSTLVPVNVVATSYHSPGFNGNDNVTDYRGPVLKAITNGVVRNDSSAEGFDTFNGDSNGDDNDFVGLLYNTLSRFDTVEIEMAVNFGDGGDWDSQPRVFVLKNPVDTDTTAPETDPVNWFELVGAVESNGHVFDQTNAGSGVSGGTLSFDLSGFSLADRKGFGIAVGGADGNGAFNFLSISEFTVTGAIVPEPASCVLLFLTAACAIGRRNR